MSDAVPHRLVLLFGGLLRCLTGVACGSLAALRRLPAAGEHTDRDAAEDDAQRIVACCAPRIAASIAALALDAC